MYLRRLASVLIVLPIAGCCGTPPKPEPCVCLGAEPASEPTPDADGLSVDVVLEEVRTQFEGEGWTPFYTGKEPPGTEPGFPGLHAPLDIISLAEQVAASKFVVDKQLPKTDLELKIRERFDQLAAELHAPYSLGEMSLTGGGSNWRLPPPPPPDPFLAFRVNQAGTKEFFKRNYIKEEGASGPEGEAWYWLLFRFRRLTE